jgi:electron transfer flavoprotein beta subunit
MANEMSLPTIAVLISPALHPVSGKALRSASDAAAFELACRLTSEQRITVICAGMVSKDSLNDYLGIGVGAIDVITVDQGVDVVNALLARLQGMDLVLCGTRSQGQSATGLLPFLLAEGLQIPMVGDVLEASYQSGVVNVRQFLPKGMRRRLEVSLPALLSVHSLAPQQRQYAYARARAGRVNYLAASTAAIKNKMSTPVAQTWEIEPSLRRPRPLKAKIVQSGHSRMLGAIGSDADAKGGVILKEGSADQKAQAVLLYLREHSLIDF